ncbi:uncharacterized protein [Dermacentor andersoni]|uniref:uncharacterized protein n=1 Tax=Dermacentor andersoni TaxID=34620 RepID=UPI002416A89A|nr:uncharacterized protein LOC126520836 isoform X2 [Dermacentor andersoni]
MPLGYEYTITLQEEIRPDDEHINQINDKEATQGMVLGYEFKVTLQEEIRPDDEHLKQINDNEATQGSLLLVAPPDELATVAHRHVRCCCCCGSTQCALVTTLVPVSSDDSWD